jgi:hypothetical protein
MIGGRGIPTWVRYVLIGLVVLAVIKQPTNMAHTATRAGAGIGYAAGQFGTFIGRLGE